MEGGEGIQGVAVVGRRENPCGRTSGGGRYGFRPGLRNFSNNDFESLYNRANSVIELAGA